MGESVGMTFDGFLKAGNHEITFDMGDLVSGVYFYRLTTSDTSETRKMILLK
jgi:hypothetical protein